MTTTSWATSSTSPPGSSRPPARARCSSGEPTFRLVRARGPAAGRPAAGAQGQGGAGAAPSSCCRSTRARTQRARPRRSSAGPGSWSGCTAVLDAAIGDRRARSSCRSSARPAWARPGWRGSWCAAAADRARVVDGALRARRRRHLRAGGRGAARRPRRSTTTPTDETVVAGLTALFDEDEPDRERIAQRPRRRCSASASPGLPGGDVLGGAPPHRERAPGAARSSSCSRTSTGPSRSCSTSSRTWPTGSRRAGAAGA